MSDDTLLDIAKRNLEIAILIYETKQDDEAFLNIVGYHLQQSVEIGLKHYLETHGIKYSKTHDIQELLSLIPDDDMERFDRIEDLAGTITQLESKTRYIKNYRVSKRTIDKIFPVADSLLKDMSKLKKEEEKIAQKENIKENSSGRK